MSFKAEPLNSPLAASDQNTNFQSLGSMPQMEGVNPPESHQNSQPRVINSIAFDPSTKDSAEMPNGVRSGDIETVN